MNSGKKIELEVSGMTCTNCSLTVSRTLEKSGLKDVNVNFATGEVTFEEANSSQVDQAITNINGLATINDSASIELTSLVFRD